MRNISGALRNASSASLFIARGKNSEDRSSWSFEIGEVAAATEPTANTLRERREEIVELIREQ